MEEGEDYEGVEVDVVGVILPNFKYGGKGELMRLLLDSVLDRCNLERGVAPEQSEVFFSFLFFSFLFFSFFFFLFFFSFLFRKRY